MPYVPRLLSVQVAKWSAKWAAADILLTINPLESLDCLSSRSHVSWSWNKPNKRSNKLLTSTTRLSASRVEYFKPTHSLACWKGWPPGLAHDVARRLRGWSRNTRTIPSPHLARRTARQHVVSQARAWLAGKIKNTSVLQKFIVKLGYSG